ncbi:alpha/beta fold hydrolase [Streptomyces sp. SL13]|uniref:Alpha/beta fold hydrolase n=1 Tax=Streptantibioticus silvisoli TaxID=2705255 RepID=A0AA90H104_9ACTN|nr:alpha/beta fold hydrolase [Streptantibioticus silvisoli]MDI5965480.1 alpha/beta fold hydrolase [Streptantibioticus silvisoli]MDI5968914.1 alpha/beta fold hydrolase [Streptantibioticus silvisoli]
MAKPVEDDSLWIRRFHPRPDSEVRLVCLPHAGGSASFYFPMSDMMGTSVEVLSVQYPGRQDRRAEPCISSIPELADLVAAALVPWADRPLVFFGHSMGATLGFEVARRLERDHGIVLVGLFASARRAPSRKRHETVHQRDDRGIITELQRLSGTNSQIMGDEELLRMVLPAIRADYRAAETYEYDPGPKLRCPIVSLVGDDDPKVTMDEARAWGEHTESSFDFQVFPGGHFYLASHQSEIVNAISDHVLTQLRLKPSQ